MKMYGITPSGRISKRKQKDYTPPFEGYTRIEGRRDDGGVRKRPPKRIYVYEGEAYTSVRAVSRAIGCSEDGFKRAVRNGRRKILFKNFEVWEKT